MPLLRRLSYFLKPTTTIGTSSRLLASSMAPRYHFINTQMSMQMNEIFTDEEMSMTKDPLEEATSLHREFNDKFFQTIESSLSTRFQSIEEIVESNLQSSILSTSSNPAGTSHANSPASLSQSHIAWLNSARSSHGSSLVIPPNFQNTLRRMKSVYSVLEKLQIAYQYCKQLKQQVREIEANHRDYLLQFLQPVIQSINEDPTRQEQMVLFTLLNLSREDFLNFPLQHNVVYSIKRLILEQYETFDKESIKNVFSAQSNRHKDTPKSFIDTNVLKCWFNYILSRVQVGEISEREMILFLNCFQKDTDLFRKNHKVISQMILKEAQTNGILKNSKNADLLKVLVTTFTRNEQHCTQPLLELFYDLTIAHIQKDYMSIMQFQAILRQLLRSQTFMNSRIMSSFGVVNDQAGIVGGGVVVDDEKFKVIDNFVSKHIDALQNNQILNILNLYQTINASNLKSTVVKLLDRLFQNFTPQCDNFFSFNITVRVLSLFKIEDPKKYLSYYKTWQKREVEISGMAKQVANTLAILKYCIPGDCYTSSMEKTHYGLLQTIKQEELKNSSMTLLSSQQQGNGAATTTMSLKKTHFAEIYKALERIGVDFKTFLFIDSIHVDLYVFAEKKKFIAITEEEKAASAIARAPASAEVLPPFSFAIDITSANDYVIPNQQLNGSLQLKYEVLHKMHFPCVVLTEEFCEDLLSIQSQNLQTKLLISHINKQIHQLSQN